MGWTNPITVNVGDVAHAADWNTYIRDNEKALAAGASHVHVGTTPFERWYAAGAMGVLDVTTAAFATGTLFAVPYPNMRGGTVDRISFEVTTLGASGVGRAGIYAATSDTNIYPSALVVDGGELSTNTTGIKTATISTVLTPTVLYWFVVLFGVAGPSLRGISASSWATLNGIMGISATSWATNPSASRLTVAQTYGALPSTFPSSAAFDTNAPPIIAVRYSA